MTIPAISNFLEIFIPAAEAKEGDSTEETLEEAARREPEEPPEEKPATIRITNDPIPVPEPEPDPPQCPTTFFYTNDSKIPAEYKLPFQKLAARAGSTTAVDSCDMDSFYVEMGIGSGQRKTNPQEFIKEKFSWSDWEFVNVFDYEAFYNHLAESVRKRFFPEVVDVEQGFRKEGQDIAKLTEASKKKYEAVSAKEPSAGLEKLANQFAETYPYFVATPPSFAIGYKPQIYSTGSVDENNIVSGAGLMIAGSDNFYSLNLPFDEDKDQTFSEVRAKQYDRSGDVTWYLNIEREALWDAIPDALLTGQELSKVLAERYEIPVVETNMTQDQWKQFESAEGASGYISILYGMQGAVPDDAAVKALVQKRIGEQVKEDANLYGWVREIKHWWNSWEWWWNN